MFLRRHASYRIHLTSAFFLLLLLATFATRPCMAAADGNAPAKPAPPKDTIVFTNGDQLSGTLTREVGGNVMFHSDIVGDVTVSWDKIKELHTQTKFAVLDKSVTPERHKLPPNVPQGTISVADSMVTVHQDNGVLIEPIPIKSAQYIVNEAELTKQLIGKPGFFEAWNGTATAGATIIESTQKQYTYTGAVSLIRTVPTVSWLNPTNRTTVDFSGSYGKSTQPAYISEGVLYPESDTKTALYHADAERDQYFKPRFYALGQTSFDHNYSLLLDLQQIYGGGIGWTVVKQAKQELDVKATIQYEKQTFINASGGTNQNLIGSTFAGTYLLHLPKSIVLNQQFSYIPAYNNPYAYSATETDGLTFPAYKNFGFTVGSTDTYLNDPAPAVPATKRNSFQMMFGLTYALKSKY